MEGVGAVYNDPQTTNRLADRLKQVMGDANVVLGRPIMASDDFAEYRYAGIPSVMLELGAVNPEKYAEAMKNWSRSFPGRIPLTSRPIANPASRPESKSRWRRFWN